MPIDLDFRKNPAVLNMVVDAMADGVFTVDAHGIFMAWSAGAERITGYSSAEVVGQPCRLLEGPNCKGFSTLAELLESPTPPPAGICNQECKVQAKDGRELYLHGNVRLVTDRHGDVVGAVGTFTDLTAFVLANERIALLEEQARSRRVLQQIVGACAPMQEVFRRLRLAAQSEVTVVLTGESGTGKELAARAIHALSARKDRPFIAVNCSAIPETLLESELFGHVKGAFTGAIRDKVGVFQAAHSGTLFLDEVGDMTPLLQLKLLRVLQEREIRRVGDERSIAVDVRLITATNKDLSRLLASGALREDFYYRIRVFEITLPPLRERREDIPRLVDHFIVELARTSGKAITGIARDALQRLLDYPWPGNVRELRNAIEHAFVTVGGDRITLIDLPLEIRTFSAHPASVPAPSLPMQDNAAARRRILDALRQTGGNRTAAAQHLGISRVTLWKRMRQLGLASSPATDC